MIRMGQEQGLARFFVRKVIDIRIFVVPDQRPVDNQFGQMYILVKMTDQQSLVGLVNLAISRTLFVVTSHHRPEYTNDTISASERISMAETKPMRVNAVIRIHSVWDLKGDTRIIRESFG